METEGGWVQGQSIRLGLFRSMDVFKGIPFAAPPRKFEKPERHPGWNGEFKHVFINVLDKIDKFERQISSVLKTSLFQLHLLAKVKPYLHPKQFETSIHAFISSRQDYRLYSPNAGIEPIGSKFCCLISD